MDARLPTQSASPLFGVTESLRLWNDNWSSIRNNPLAWISIVVSVVGLAVVIYIENLPSPFLDHDDFPFVTSPDAPGWYMENYVPTEGRWLMWFWSFAARLFPPGTVFTIDLFLWSISCAFIAFLVPLPNERVAARIALGLMLVCSPHFAYEARWPFGIFPLLAVLAIISLHVNYLADRIENLPVLTVLMLLVVLSFQAITFYFWACALLLLSTRAVYAAGCGSVHSSGIAAYVWQVIKAGLIWTTACAIATLIQFSLQYINFGVFGLRIGEWRIKLDAGASAVDRIIYALKQPWSVAEFYYNDMFVAVLGAGVALVILVLCAARQFAIGRAANAQLLFLIVLAHFLMFFAIASITLVSSAYIPLRAAFVCWITMVAPVWFAIVIARSRTEVVCSYVCAALVIIGGISAGSKSIAEAREARRLDEQHLSEVKRRLEAKFINYEDRVMLAGIPVHLKNHPHVFFDDIGAAGLNNWKVQIRNFISCGNLHRYQACLDIVRDTKAAEALKVAPAFPDDSSMFRLNGTIFVKLGPVKLDD